MSKSAYRASIDAADEIGVAVLASTMSIVTVFVPVGLMPGVAGQFFKNFGLSVVASVLVSLAVARMLTPMIAAYFLKAKGHVLARRRPDDGLVHDHAAMDDAPSLGRRYSAAASRSASKYCCSRRCRRHSSRRATRTRSRPTSRWFPALRSRKRTGSSARRRKSCARANMSTRSMSVRSLATAASAQAGDQARPAQRPDPEADHAASSLRSPTRASPSRSNSGWGGGGRDLTITLGGEDPAVLNATANKLVDEMASARHGGRAARRRATCSGRRSCSSRGSILPPASASPPRHSARRSASPRSAIFRRARRNSRCRTARSRSASRWTRMRARKLDTIKNLAVPTSTGGSVPLNVIADISLRRRPDAHPAPQPAAPDHGRCRSCGRSEDGQALCLGHCHEQDS